MLEVGKLCNEKKEKSDRRKRRFIFLYTIILGKNVDFTMKIVFTLIKIQISIYVLLL